MRNVTNTGIALISLWLVLAPSLANAQASITGVVKDTSGAVLPGVTVEAASDVLIEKVRTAVTDGTGQYRIVDLRSGTYTVTFSLTGFSNVKRDGIELTGSLTAAVNAEMRVGTLGGNDHGDRRDADRRRAERPAADDDQRRRAQRHPHGARLRRRHAADSRDSDPGLVAGQRAADARHDRVRHAGGRNGNEGRLQVDGLGVGAARNGGGVSGYNADVANAQEITFTVSAGLGEAEVSGPALSIVPKTGGNSLKGSVYVAGVSSGMVGNNYTDGAARRWA